MRVSLRRTLRVGKRAGEPVEDLGVTRDHAHEMTRDDLLKGNVDLLNAAGKLLSKGTPRKFAVDVKSAGQKLGLKLSTKNIEAIDVYVDGRPVFESTAISDGTSDIDIDKPSSGSLVEIDGIDKGEIVAARKHLI